MIPMDKHAMIFTHASCQPPHNNRCRLVQNKVWTALIHTIAEELTGTYVEGRGRGITGVQPTITVFTWREQLSVIQ